MKKLLYSYSTFVVILVFLFTGNSLILAQENEPTEPYMEFSYWKNTKDQKVLRARMSYFTKIAQMPMEGLEIQFYTGEEEPEKLGSAMTNSKGLAEFVVDDEALIPLNADGQMYFYAEFEGTDEVYPAMEEVWAQDVSLEMILTQEEGERQVVLSAKTMVDGELVPVTDEDIYIYVPRMFSDLQVGEGYFLEDGTTVVDFPASIPGDSIGNLTIIARFNDHYLFGNVEKRESAPWGVPSYHEGPKDVRALWTQVAPKWMIITLSILLAGVWGHYIFTIVSMVRISKNGKNMNKKS